jgi:hypothetical protein
MLFLQNYEAFFSRSAIALAKTPGADASKIICARSRPTAIEADGGISNRWLASAKETKSPRFTVTRGPKTKIIRSLARVRPFDDNFTFNGPSHDSPQMILIIA